MSLGTQYLGQGYLGGSGLQSQNGSMVVATPRLRESDNLLIGNDQALELIGLKYLITEEAIIDATVTATVKNRAGTAVSGYDWPLTLEYVEDSNGDYRGNLEDGLELLPATMYSIEIEADCGGDVIGNWKFNRQAVYRQP